VQVTRSIIPEALLALLLIVLASSRTINQTSIKLTGQATGGGYGAGDAFTITACVRLGDGTPFGQFDPINRSGFMILSQESYINQAISFAGFDLEADSVGLNSYRASLHLHSNSNLQHVDHHGCTEINDGKFHGIVATYDGSSPNRTIKIYVDGSLEKTGNGLPAGIDFKNPDAELRVGSRMNDTYYSWIGSVQAGIQGGVMSPQDALVKSAECSGATPMCGGTGLCGNGKVDRAGNDGVVGTADDEQCDNGGYCEKSGLACPNDEESSRFCGICIPQSGDGCSATCKEEICGDNIVQNDEECDDGDQDNADFCTNNCAVAYCGDGIVGSNLFAPEECDDSNTTDEDGCSSQCETEFCGDGVIQKKLDEQCDNGTENSQTPNACRQNCKLPVCGDSITDSDEECDDGKNGNDYDGCSDICRLLECVEDSDCDGKSLNGFGCGFCINGSTRGLCECNNGKCVGYTVRDCGCTTGECNKCEEADSIVNGNGHQSNCGPYGSDLPNTNWMCEWCMLAELYPPNPGPVERDECQPYPNAEILWPEHCSDSDDGSSSRNGSSKSSSSGSSDLSESNSFSFSEGSESSDYDSNSASFSFSYSLSTSISSKSLSASVSTSSTNSTTGTGSSSSISEGDDSADDGGFSSEGADDSTSDSSSFSTWNGSSSSSESDDAGDVASSIVSEGTDGEDSSDSSISSSYAQCDFCPACTACRRCGIGLANLCDAVECSELGLCVYEDGLVSGSCIADPDICSVCE